MDVIAALRSRIDELPEGDHSRGLRSVLTHIEVAFSHVTRGEQTNSDEAFTDAIYRCNQAFEGSIKEAYRVLVEKDPSKTSPYNIEKHLDKEKILSDRVLKLFTNYRTEWRNASTHDHTLDFDQSEAFVAIMSIVAFAKVLIDQISQTLASRAAAAAVERTHVEGSLSTSLADGVANTLIAAYGAEILRYHSFAGETEAVGAVFGVLQHAFPDFEFSLNKSLDQDRRYRPDIVMRKDNEALIVEVKFGAGASVALRGQDQAAAYINVSGIKNAVVFVLSPTTGQPLKAYPFGGENDEVLVLTTEFADTSFVANE